MHLLTNRFREMNTKGQIVGVFHGDAAYMMVNDEAYNAYRKVITGNPYKGLLAELLKQEVQIEECVVSMKNHAWGTEDLLPGVKVNAGTVGRLIQLTQEHNVQIQPYTWRVQRRSKGEKQCKTMPPSFSAGLHFTLGREEIPSIINVPPTQEKVDLVVLLSHLGFPQDRLERCVRQRSKSCLREYSLSSQTLQNRSQRG